VIAILGGNEFTAATALENSLFLRLCVCETTEEPIGIFEFIYDCYYNYCTYYYFMAILCEGDANESFKNASLVIDPFRMNGMLLFVLSYI